MIEAPPHVPTAETREVVCALVSFGNVEDDIARYLGIERHTLQRYYPEELVIGRNQALNKAGMKLYQMAMSGNISALIFYLKTKGRWSEVHQLETPDGRALGTFAKMDGEQLSSLIASLNASLAAEESAGRAEEASGPVKPRYVV